MCVGPVMASSCCRSPVVHASTAGLVLVTPLGRVDEVWRKLDSNAWFLLMNSSKNKGDRGEREAVVALCALAPDYVLPNARRKLGAGRRDDMGDIDVFPDVTIQVKCMASLPTALREAAVGANVQSARAGTSYALGMSPIPRSRKSGVRWLASTTSWPGGPPSPDAVLVTGQSQVAVAHAQAERAGIPRRRRIAVVRRSGLVDLYVAPMEAWVDAWLEDRRSRVAEIDVPKVRRMVPNMETLPPAVSEVG